MDIRHILSRTIRVLLSLVGGYLVLNLLIFLITFIPNTIDGFIRGHRSINHYLIPVKELVSLNESALFSAQARKNFWLYSSLVEKIITAAVLFVCFYLSSYRLIIKIRK